MSVPFLTVLDVETSGFRRDAQVQEIGCVAVDENFNVINWFHTLVHSHDAMEEAQAVHGISSVMTEDAPEWPEVLEFVMSTFILPARMLGGCNVGFDLRMILPESCQFTPTSSRRHILNLKQSLSKECQRHMLPDEGSPHYALRGAIAATACLKESNFGFLPGLGSRPPLSSQIKWNSIPRMLTAKPRGVDLSGQSNEVFQAYRLQYAGGDHGA